MLGEILGSLTNAMIAEDVIAAVVKPEMLQRIRMAADEGGTPVGTLVASRMRHVVDHGAEQLWVDLLGVMAGSPQPGAAAIERMIAHAFPDPVRVRIKRSSGEK